MDPPRNTWYAPPLRRPVTSREAGLPSQPAGPPVLAYLAVMAPNGLLEYGVNTSSTAPMMIRPPGRLVRRSRVTVARLVETQPALGARPAWKKIAYEAPRTVFESGG